MSAGFPVQTGTLFTASAGARAPAPSAIRSLCWPAAGGPADRAPPVLQGSGAHVLGARTPGLSPAAVRHRAAVSKQPFRHRELARPTAHVCTLTRAARSLGLHQVAAKGDWGSGCTRAGRLLGPKGWRSAKVGRGGAVGSGRASSGCGAASERSACPGTRSARLPCP